MKEPPLSLEDRLTAIAYQFVNLYERWSEDRQVAAKHSAEIADLVNRLTVQVSRLEGLAPEVEESLKKSVFQAAQSVTQSMAQPLRQEVIQQTKIFASNLDRLLHSAQEALLKTSVQSFRWQLQMLGLSLVCCLMISFFFIKFWMPRPHLPLMEDQVRKLANGYLLETIWPHMTEGEKTRFEHLVDMARKNGETPL